MFIWYGTYTCLHVCISTYNGRTGCQLKKNLICFYTAAFQGWEAVKPWGKLSVCLQLWEFLGTTLPWHLVQKSAREIIAGAAVAAEGRLQ